MVNPFANIQMNKETLIIGATGFVAGAGITFGLLKAQQKRELKKVEALFKAASNAATKAEEDTHE